MRVARDYRFDSCTATTASGSPCVIAAGTYTVIRNTLSVQVKIGGRDIDLTLAEFARLEAEGKVSQTRTQAGGPGAGPGGGAV